MWATIIIKRSTIVHQQLLTTCHTGTVLLPFALAHTVLTAASNSGTVRQWNALRNSWKGWKGYNTAHQSLTRRCMVPSLRCPTCKLSHNYETVRKRGEMPRLEGSVRRCAVLVRRPRARLHVLRTRRVHSHCLGRGFVRTRVCHRHAPFVRGGLCTGCDWAPAKCQRTGTTMLDQDHPAYLCILDGIDYFKARGTCILYTTKQGVHVYTT